MTAFEPFGSASVNYSKSVAETVKLQLSQKNVDVEVCILPVVYDLAAVKARECYSKINPPPVLALSLGEGDCKIRMETAAHNLDDTPGFPDNAGNIRVRQKIDVQQRTSVAFGNHVVDMYCSLDSNIKSAISISESPGGYVCNNTAFHLGHFFRKKGIPYSFIHVPSNSCGSEQVAEASGRVIAGMIENTGLVKDSDFKKTVLNQFCTELPTNTKSIQELLSKLNEISEPEIKRTCEPEFLDKLQQRIRQWGTGKGATY